MSILKASDWKVLLGCFKRNVRFIMYTCVQDEGESLQQQHEREKEVLQQEADKAWREVGRLEMEGQQAAARASQDMDTLKHNHDMNQVRKVYAIRHVLMGGPG